MSARALFTAIALCAAGAGTAMWWAMRPAVSEIPAPGTVAPAALFAASFADAAGRSQTLAQFQGKVVVVNFWATWCAPCREEMPAFVHLQARWGARGVQFVGLAQDDPGKVARFGADLAINYPLWTGGDQVTELSRRLGNRLGALPHTAILGPAGEVLETRVGPYTEREMESRLTAFTAKIR
ncbi:MAG TPA: TlpA disulfide reductase family protein [Usitatibacter sp.]|nr:TlpA disulfide reductase family protein [Usitatibacter sp.]